MQLLPIDQLEPGMTLAQDILDAAKRILLTTGAELTSHQIGLLKARGIAAVAIATADRSDGVVLPDPRITPELLHQAEQRIDYRLKHALTIHPAVASLRAKAVRRLALRLADPPLPAPAPKG